MKSLLDTPMTLVDVFTKACTKFHDRPAFTCAGKTISYAELQDLSQCFAAYLQHNTLLKPGDRIAVQLPNILQYPIVTFGAWQAGLIVVNTNPLYTATEMEHQFKDARVKALVAFSGMSEKVEEVVKHTEISSIITAGAGDLHEAIDWDESPAEQKNLSFRDALILGRKKELQSIPLNREDIAALQYTGGTTGIAKGAMLSHRNLVANTLQMVEHSSAFFEEGNEVYVAALPLYHIYAFSIHCVALLHMGGHNLLIPNPRYLPSIVETILPHAITGFPGINTLFDALCHNEPFCQLDFSHLKSTASGGMSLSPDVAKKWKELTGVQIAEGYGLSEASPVVTANPPNNIQSGTVGSALPETQIRVIDRAGNTLPAGEPGELLVKGPQIMQGYWQRPDATRDVLSSDGWLHTGDIAIIQEDGYVRIVDRLKDIIVVSGFNVYPNEVEHVAALHPSVRECAAIGVPDAKSGEIVKLFVVGENESFDPQVLNDFLRARLTAYKCPKYIEVMNELPKSNVGKVLKRLLR